MRIVVRMRRNGAARLIRDFRKGEPRHRGNATTRTDEFAEAEALDHAPAYAAGPWCVHRPAILALSCQDGAAAGGGAAVARVASLGGGRVAFVEGEGVVVGQ